MKTDVDFFLWIMVAVIYIWGMVVLATYLMHSLWVMSAQSSRMIEESLELLLQSS